MRSILASLLRISSRRSSHSSRRCSFCAASRTRRRKWPSSHPSGLDDGEMGKGNRMQDRRLHMTVPVPGEGNSRGSLFHGHNSLRKESLLLDFGGYHKCCIFNRFWSGDLTTNSLDQDSIVLLIYEGHLNSDQYSHQRKVSRSQMIFWTRVSLYNGDIKMMRLHSRLVPPLF